MTISNINSVPHTQDEMLTTIYKGINQNSEQTSENFKKIFSQIESLLTLAETHRKRLCALESHNLLLESEIEYLKSLHYFSHRSSEIKVTGIPRSCNIPLRDITKLILKKMDLDFLCNDVLDVRPLVSSNVSYINSQQNVLTFVVKFKSVTTLDYVLQTKRRFGILTSNDLFNDLDDKAINIYEMLPAPLHSLKLLAKNKAKLENYKYVWSRNGNIYVKKDDYTEKLTILTSNDLLKIK